MCGSWLLKVKPNTSYSAANIGSPFYPLHEVLLLKISQYRREKREESIQCLTLMHLWSLKNRKNLSKILLIWMCFLLKKKLLGFFPKNSKTTQNPNSEYIYHIKIVNHQISSSKGKKTNLFNQLSVRLLFFLAVSLQNSLWVILFHYLFLIDLCEYFLT